MGESTGARPIGRYSSMTQSSVLTKLLAFVAIVLAVATLSGTLRTNAGTISPAAAKIATCRSAVAEFVREHRSIVAGRIECRAHLDGGAGLSAPGLSRIAADANRGYLLQVVAHEAGHLWAFRGQTETDRAEYMILRGFDGGPAAWWSSGAGEDFADVFAYALGMWSTSPDPSRGWRTGGYGYPNPDVIASLRGVGLIP